MDYRGLTGVGLDTQMFASLSRLAIQKMSVTASTL